MMDHIIGIFIVNTDLMSTVHKSLQALYIYVHNLHFFFSNPLERSGLARDGLTKKKKKKNNTLQD